jgi:hypothetical protein
MSADNELIGYWSADVMYGPGGQSDDDLVFRPDGTGFMEFSNPCTTFAELFRWSVESPGRLEIRGFKTRYVGEDEPTRVEERDSALDVTVGFQVQVESTKAGRSMRVLRFAERPWQGISDHFGFCRELHGQEEPNFSWVESWNVSNTGTSRL